MFLSLRFTQSKFPNGFSFKKLNFRLFLVWLSFLLHWILSKLGTSMITDEKEILQLFPNYFLQRILSFSLFIAKPVLYLIFWKRKYHSTKKKHGMTPRRDKTFVSTRYLLQAVTAKLRNKTAQPRKPADTKDARQPHITARFKSKNQNNPCSVTEELIQ